METIFQNEFFIQIILPFLLVFALFYAILSKTGVLHPQNQPNKGVDVLVALAIALIFVGVPAATGFTLRLMPILSVLIVIAFSIILLLAFTGVWKENENKVYGINIGISIALGIAFIIAILWAAGIFERISGLSKEMISNFAQWIVLIILIIVAIVAVVQPGQQSREEKGKGSS